MKRGTKIEYRYAGGKIVAGKIVKADEVDHGWFIVELTDEAGTYRGCCHGEQIRNVDNRPSFAAG